MKIAIELLKGGSLFMRPFGRLLQIIMLSDKDSMESFFN